MKKNPAHLINEDIKMLTNLTTGKVLAKQKCHECDKPIKPIWKDICNNPDTWFWRECDTCSEAFCDKCSDIEEGIVQCLTCYQQEVIQHQNGEINVS